MFQFIFCDHVHSRKTSSSNGFWLVNLYARNNAGIMLCPFMLSKDNIELHFATNHLGMWEICLVLRSNQPV